VALDSLTGYLPKRVQAVALLVVLIGAGLAACGERVYYPTVREAASTVAVRDDLLAEVDENHVVGVRRATDGIELLAFARESSGWRLVLTQSRAVGDAPYAVQIANTPPGESWTGSYLFGTAPPQAARVTLGRVDERGGGVHDGLWVLVIDRTDVDPRTLGWRFLALDGSPLQVGTGLLPAGA
jgi:hypothetical protein